MWFDHPYRWRTIGITYSICSVWWGWRVVVSPCFIKGLQHAGGSLFHYIRLGLDWSIIAPKDKYDRDSSCPVTWCNFLGIKLIFQVQTKQLPRIFRDNPQFPIREKVDGVQIPYISCVSSVLCHQGKKEDLIDTEVLTTRIPCQILEVTEPVENTF